MPFVQPPEQSCHCILVNGRSGSGKTYQFRKLVEAGFTPVYATTENKYGTVKDLLTPQNFFEIKNPFFPLTVSEKQSTDGKYKSDLIELYDILRSPTNPFDLLFFDSGMFYLQDLLKHIENAMKLAYPANYAEFGKRSDHWFRKTSELVSPRWPKPVDVIITWGVERDVDWTGKRTTQPIMDGKRTKPMVPFHFDHVVYLESRYVAGAEGMEKEFVMHTQGTDEFEAKVSSPTRFEPVIVNPDLGQVLRQLKGGNGVVGGVAAQPNQPARLKIKEQTDGSEASLEAAAD